MAMAQTRNEEIRDIHAQYADFYRIGRNVLLVVIGVAIGAVLFSGEDPLYEDLTGYFTNLYTEAISVGLTILVLNNLQARRDKRNREQDLKDQLIREAGSRVNVTALTAIDMISKREWLKGEDGILKSADLPVANLRNARLGEANLHGADLAGAILQGAHLWAANLQSADLNTANLKSADLGLTNLQGADLNTANLKGVSLVGSNLKGAKLAVAILQGANLEQANLRGAVLRLAKFNEETTLPDGTKWTPDTDMARFTDPNHPDFWQPYWSKKKDDKA